MHGFIANTDDDWFKLLKQRQDAGVPFDEVNFWRPSDKPPAHILQVPGTPVIFRLKSPENKIGGFGFVQRFSILPDWLAWDAFKEANGVVDFADLTARLTRIRERNKIEGHGEVRIGCILLTQPVFLPREHWVKLPACWKPNTVTGQEYDLRRPRVGRLRRACRPAAAAGPRRGATRVRLREAYGGEAAPWTGRVPRRSPRSIWPRVRRHQGTLAACP